MKKLLRVVSIRSDFYRRRAHELLGKPRPSFYALLVAPPLIFLVGSGFLLVSSARRADIGEVNSIKSEQISARELADAQARALEARSGHDAERFRSSIQQEYSQLLSENAELAIRVSELQKAAPIKAYMLYQQALAEAAKAEQERRNASLKKQAEAGLEAQQAELCVLSKADLEVKKSTYSAEKLAKEFQGVKELCR